MLPTLFASLLAITAGLLFHQNWNLHQTNASLNQALKEQNLQVREQQLSFMKEMREDVKEEMLNMGLNRNKGLLDTLLSIKTQTDTLLRKAMITQESFDDYKKELGAIIRSQFSGKSYRQDDLYGWTVDSMFRVDESLLEKTISYILKCEKEALEVLNMRLGTTHCWGGYPRIQSLPLVKTVVLGDTLRQKLQIYKYNGSPIIADPQTLTIDYSASMGFIEENKFGEMILSIPTEGLLKPYEFSRKITFGIHAVIHTATGRYKTTAEQDSFLLVKPAR